MDANVSRFVAITGASSEAAMRLLEACGGNLDLAINMHLESGGSPAPSAAGPSGNSTRASDDILSPKSYEELYGVRAPIPQTRGVLVEEDTPPRRILRSRRLPQTVFDPFQDYSKAAPSSSRKLPGPGNDDKKRSLAELFKPPHDIMFHGSFHEARLAGEHRKKWVLVNVQDSKEFASQVLNRDVWSNDNVKDIVREHFVFWQIHRITDDGIKFKQLYHIESYPYIAIIDPRTGEKMTHWSSLSASEFTKAVQEYLATHTYDDGDHQLVNSKESTVVELSEQSQLEAAIQASLQDCHATKKSSKYELIFSDSDSDGGGGENDHIYLSSDSNSDMDETDGGWIHSSDDVHLVSDTNLQVHTSTMSMATIDSPASLKPPMDSNSNVKTKPINSHVKSLLEDVPPQQTRRNRKRTSSPSSSQDECPRKVPRSNTTDSISDGSHHSAAISHSSTCRSNGPVKAQSPRKSKRNKQNNADDDEQQQMLSSDTTDVEKLLETGAIGKDEVSHILFRLPDGTRLQKAFICSHPIKEVLEFLQIQGLNLSEHEVVTHFPRRNISEINPNINFKEAGLYPRETVFVHTAE